MEIEHKLIEEYKEVNANMRHFSNMRIAVLTLCLAINGVLIQSILQQENVFIISGLILLGIVSTLSFFIFENRVSYYYFFYHSRAKELEDVLLLNQHNRPLPKTFFSATNATRFLYIAIAIFWIILTIYKL